MFLHGNFYFLFQSFTILLIITAIFTGEKRETMVS